jgi:hypothetical protein
MQELILHLAPQYHMNPACNKIRGTALIFTGCHSQDGHIMDRNLEEWEIETPALRLRHAGAPCLPPNRNSVTESMPQCPWYPEADAGGPDRSEMANASHPLRDRIACDGLWHNCSPDSGDSGCGMHDRDILPRDFCLLIEPHHRRCRPVPGLHPSALLAHINLFPYPFQNIPNRNCRPVPCRDTGSHLYVPGLRAASPFTCYETRLPIHPLHQLANRFHDTEAA